MKLSRITLILIFPFIISCMSGLNELERRYIEIAENVLPSVVEVITVGIDEDKESKWFDFFKDQEENRRNDFESSGLGSGVIVESNGDEYYIITNSHVVADSKVVTIITNDQKYFDGVVIGNDPRFDFSLIKIVSKEELPVAELNLENDIKVGQFVAALGSPMGYAQSLSMGVVSHIGRYGGPKNNISNFIQTDASINQGNSGGPLVNLQSQVVGINTWISSPSGGSVGLGFAVPIKNIYPSLRSLIDTGAVNKSWIGISTGQLPKSAHYMDRIGAFIYQVVIDSPAYKSDLRPGDIIKKINNKDIKSSNDLILELSLLKPQDTVLLVVDRNNEEYNIDVILNESKEDILDISKKIAPGFLIQEEGSKIILLQVMSKSIGQAAGFKKDDTIKKINGIDIIRTEDVYNSLKKGKNKVIIGRDEEELELELNY